MDGILKLQISKDIVPDLATAKIELIKVLFFICSFHPDRAQRCKSIVPLSHGPFSTRFETSQPSSQLLILVRNFSTQFTFGSGAADGARVTLGSANYMQCRVMARSVELLPFYVFH